MRFVKTIAIIAVSTAGLAGIGTGAQAQQEQIAADQVCTVHVERDQPDGIFDVTRQIFDDGSCNCFIYTGSPSQATNVESQVLGILESQRCPNARPMMVEGPGAAGAGAGGANGVLAPVLLGAGAAGLIVALESTSP